MLNNIRHINMNQLSRRQLVIFFGAAVLVIIVIFNIIFWRASPSKDDEDGNIPEFPPPSPSPPEPDSIFPQKFFSVPIVALENPQKPLRVIWVFWLGGLDKMTPPRARAFKMMKKNMGVPLRIITSMEEMKKLSKPEDPIHPLIFAKDPQVIASNHIVDYMRAYIMKHYGGGYFDVKPMFYSWADWFDKFDDDPDLWHVAPRLRGRWDVGCNESYLVAMGLKPPDCKRLRYNWQYIGSDACWIARPYTPLSIEFHKLVNDTLNRKWKEMLKNPVPQKFKNKCCCKWMNEQDWKEEWPSNARPDYPLRWLEMHAEAFDPLQIKWNRYIKLGLPRYDEQLQYT